MPAQAKSPRISVTETNIRKTAKRVLSGALVSTEVQYLQRTLGSSTSVDALESGIRAVRALPWDQIVVPE